jgi:hypothetical protein
VCGPPIKLETFITIYCEKGREERKKGNKEGEKIPFKKVSSSSFSNASQAVESIEATPRFLRDRDLQFKIFLVLM